MSCGLHSHLRLHYTQFFAVGENIDNLFAILLQGTCRFCLKDSKPRPRVATLHFLLLNLGANLLRIEGCRISQVCPSFQWTSFRKKLVSLVSPLVESSAQSQVRGGNS